MKRDEFRTLGTALDDRVAAQVDPTARLEMLVKARRRARVASIAFAAIGAVAVLIAAVFLSQANDEVPVVTDPPTTIAPDQGALEPLPVEVYVVLKEGYSVDSDTGACSGTGPLSGFFAGADLEIRSDTSDFEPMSLKLSGGVEVTAQDERASFLLGEGLLGCVFQLPDPGLGIDRFENASLLPEVGDPGVVGGGMSISGQRVIFSFGDDPRDSNGSPGEGVAPEDPSALQAELQDLRASAAPGLLVVFVNLDSTRSTGPPTSPTQPLCLGVGGFAGIRPGETVEVKGPDGQTLSTAILHGAVYDGHTGCGYWFSTELSTGVGSYSVEIGGLEPITLPEGLLDEFSWLVNLWTDQNQMQANCIELEPESVPMTCLLLEEKG